MAFRRSGVRLPLAPPPVPVMVWRSLWERARFAVTVGRQVTALTADRLCAGPSGREKPNDLGKHRSAATESLPSGRLLSKRSTNVWASRNQAGLRHAEHVEMHLDIVCRSLDCQALLWSATIGSLAIVRRLMILPRAVDMYAEVSAGSICARRNQLAEMIGDAQFLPWLWQTIPICSFNRMSTSLISAFAAERAQDAAARHFLTIVT